MRRRFCGRSALVVVLCSFLVGCFEEPVREHVHINIFGPETFSVSVVQEVASSDIARGNRAVESRMDEARSGLEGGWDRWSRIFSAERPVAERTTLQRMNQEVRRSLHSAVFSSPRALSNLLAQADLGLDLHFDGNKGLVTFYPQGGSQLTSKQYKFMQQAIEEWSELVSVYLDAATTTYHYLELNPSEKLSVFSYLFDSPDREDLVMSRRAEELVAELKPAMELVAEQALEISKGEGWSLNEMCHLAFDPFPPRLTVAVAGDVSAVEGFEDLGGIWQRPTIDLWTALRVLESQWIEPRLVTALVAPGDLDLIPDPDPLEFADAPIRTGHPPTALEFQAALMAQLETTSSLSIQWRQVNPVSDDDLGPSLQAILDLTESAALYSPETQP